MQREATKPFNVTTLLFTTLVIAICSIVYELIIGSLSSYLLGDGVRQYSLTIGLYLFAMGLGSYASKYINGNLFNHFVGVEIAVGLLGGCSSMLLFLSYIYTQAYQLAMYGFTLGIGFFVGLEIPLLVRIIEQNGSSLKSGIANLFALDYIGGLLGSILFPLLLLPQMGYVTVAFFTGTLNMLAALLIIVRFRAQLKAFKPLCIITAAFATALAALAMMGNTLTTRLEGGLYRDQIVHSQQTGYQKIVMTQHKDDLRLFIDGNVQFSSMDEYRYHEALVHVPMAAVPGAQRVLLLGAGDGMAARELLKYPTIQQIVMVDIDEQLVQLCREDSKISALNGGSLSDERLQPVYTDAFIYLRENAEPFDAIIIDLPDPNNDALNKLYTTAFYRLVSNSLTEDGVMVTQSSSPYYTGAAFWCINKTLGQEFASVAPYHLYVPSFGDWGFNMAAKQPIDTANLHLAEGIQTAYLTEENFQSLFTFARDEHRDMGALNINTLTHPVLAGYYAAESQKW